MWRLPAEWEPHAATWMAWPCRYEIWPDYEATCQAFAKVIRAISGFEPVKLLVNPEHERAARNLCGSCDVEFIPTKMNDSWARDTCPLFVVREKQLAAVKWNFNAWGEKFHPFNDDANLSRVVIEDIQKSTNLPIFQPNLVLEGGSINSNGQGKLLATRSAVLNLNRNKEMTVDKMEQAFKRYLGIERVIWLDRGLENDVDTDGHIDNVACFISEDQILMQTSPELDKIEGVVTIDAPAPHGDLPLSYLNFYILNHALLIPSFRQPKADDGAKQVISDCFPGRKAIQIDALDIVAGGGGIHCITMQQPSIS